MFPRHFPSLKIPDREATTREGQLIPKMASVGEERGPLASEDEVDSEEEAELEEEHRQAKEVSRGKKKRKAKRKVSGTSPPHPLDPSSPPRARSGRDGRHCGLSRPLLARGAMAGS